MLKAKAIKSRVTGSLTLRSEAGVEVIATVQTRARNNNRKLLMGFN